MKILKKILRIVFSRTAFVILSVLLQIAFFIISLTFLSEHSTMMYVIFIVLGAFVVISILNEESNASFKMAWIIPVLMFPVFGAFFYIFVNLQLETKLMRRRLKSINASTKSVLEQNDKTFEELGAKSLGEEGLAKYLHNVDNFPVYKDNGVKYFPLGEDKFEEMKIRLRAASKFIFMEYFIVADGEMWGEILDILKQKVSEGVEVRFMYDGMCSLALLPYGYYKDLRGFGIKSIPFSQIKPVFSTYQNNRDHRKILVIDGEVAFTGGVNLADEYINKLDRFGHWKDTAVMVEGSSVKSFTIMFLTMWSVANKKNKIDESDMKKYIYDVYPSGDSSAASLTAKAGTTITTGVRKGGYVIPYSDGPFNQELIGKQVYIDILNRARDYVHIMTPYLILDDEMAAALGYCAKRGVETIIIMPHIPDKIYAYLLARTYYRELLKCGVKIYEYTPGFVHAKVFVSDDIRASIGTINLDFRSLYLHFECSTYFYNNGAVSDVERDYQETLAKSQQITVKDCDEYPIYKKFAGRALRLFAPLM